MQAYKFDLQRFADNSGLDTLKLLGSIVKTLDLKKLADDLLANSSDVSGWLKKNANPILNFIGGFLEKEATKKSALGTQISSYASLISNAILVVDNTLSIIQDKTLPDDTVKSKIGLIVGSLTSMTNTISNLNSSIKKKNIWFLSIVSAGISLTANLIAASDGVTPAEKEKINKSYITFLKTLGSDLVKKIFDEAVNKQISRAFTEDVTTDLVNDIVTKGKFFQNASKTLTKTFGVVLSFATGILNGIDEYKARMEKYIDDGIPENISKHDAFIDAVAVFIHDNASAFMKGFDDLIFKGVQAFTSWITGKEPADSNKNYIEVIADLFKTLNYKNSGTIDDDKFKVIYKDKFYMYGDNGNDYIENVASNVTIWGGHDNDTIYSFKNESVIPQSNSVLGGSGDDVIVVQDKLSTIYGGKGSDKLLSYGIKNVIYGDAGDDYIFLINGADNNTAKGGLGNDKIILDSVEGSKIFYEKGDGNDSIYGFDENNSLSISGEFSTVKGDSDITLKIGNGSILLIGAADKTIYINGNAYNVSSNDNYSITPIVFPKFEDYFTAPKTTFKIKTFTESDDIINNLTEKVLINALKGNDSISNISSKVIIEGGSGNDSIENGYYASLTAINGGTGDDYICNAYFRDLLTGYKNSGASNVTISGGDGNDFIHNGGDSVTIDTGNGNDTIRNYDDNVSIDGGDDNDTISNGGNSVTIEGGSGNDDIFTVTDDNVLINAGSGDDYISNSGGDSVTIDSGTGDDIIINKYTSDYNRDTYEWETLTPDNVSINGSDGNDKIENEGSNVTINGSDGNDFIYNYSYGYKTSISGGAGNDSIKNQCSKVTISGGDGNDYIHNTSDSVIIKGNDDNDSIENRGDNITISGGKGSDTIYNNCYREKDGTIYNYQYIDGFNLLIQYNMGDGNDFIYGFRIDSTLQISDGSGKYSTTKSGSDIIVTVGEGKISLIGAANLGNLNILGTKETLTPATLLTVADSMNSPVTVDSSIRVIDASTRTKAVKVTGNILDNTIKGGSANDSIYGGAGNDSILGNAGNDKLFGQDGDDSLSGGNGNDTLTGGNGNDVFIYSAGKDVIADYATGDIISLGSAVSKSSISGSDIVFTIGKGSLTVKNAKGKSLSMIDSTATSFSTILGGSTTSTLLTVTDKTKSPVTVGSSIQTINASKRTKTVKITANNLDNSIKGGSANDSLYGGSGNDSIFGNTGNDKLYGGTGDDILTGGKGNDSLWGNAGVDTFIYASGDGKDVIYGFDDSDLLQITGTFSASYNKSKKEIAFKVSSTANAITLKDFSATSFNLNGTNYKISGKTLKK